MLKAYRVSDGINLEELELSDSVDAAVLVFFFRLWGSAVWGGGGGGRLVCSE